MIIKSPKHKQFRYNQGQVMLISVVLFLVISMIIILGVATPILRQVKASTDLIHSKESYYVAAGGIEDAMYRVKALKTVNTGDTVTINGYTATITFINNFTNRTIISTANRNGLVRKLQSQVTVGTGASFNYALQTGIGGITMANGAGVIGNIYSNGSVTGSNTSYVTGSIYAADSAALSADQTNGVAGTPPYTINFGNQTSTTSVAQSFQVSTTGPVHHIQFYIKKVGNPNAATVKIVSDNGGVPGTNVLDTATLGDSSGASAVSSSVYGWVTATFSNNAQLTASTTYWAILTDGTVSSSNYYTVAANSGTYTNGLTKTGVYSTTWRDTYPTGLSEYFQLYLGGLTATISSLNIGTGSTGDAWAHTVNSSTIAGALYCQTGSGNKAAAGGNLSCNTSRADPAPQGYPISDANVQEWKSDASAGTTINGNYTPAANAKVGPLVVTGNMSVTGNITVTGTIWVKGNLTTNNGAIIALDPSYNSNSGIIVVDGNISISNNAQFQGSGQTNSYILLLTTSNCPTGSSCGASNAIDVSNNAGTVILNAQNGTVHISNNGGAKEITAYQLLLDNNATITYSTGLINQNFTSGPTGGWNITSWQEVQ